MAKSNDKIQTGTKVKVKVKVGRTWHPAKVVEITNEGSVARVDRLDDETDRTIYAKVEDLRVITASSHRVRGKVNGGN